MVENPCGVRREPKSYLIGHKFHVVPLTHTINGDDAVLYLRNFGHAFAWRAMEAFSMLASIIYAAKFDALFMHSARRIED